MKTLSYVNGVQQALSQDFLDAWAHKQGKGGQVLVRAKRRYWVQALNGGMGAFTYEANWITFTMGNFVEVGNITWKLDTPLLNEFKTSSVPIRFRGSLYQMLPSNVGTSGFFAPDSVALLGCEPFLTMFQIQFGYKIPSGNYELVNLFTGVAIDYLFDVQGGYAEVTVSGNEALMQYSDAQLVSNPITGGATTVDPSNNKIYTTNLNGIGKIFKVYANGVLQRQGLDYTVSGTDGYGTPATLTFGAAPTAPVTYDGTYWYTLMKIEDLVLALAIQAGLYAPGTLLAATKISAVIWAGSQGVVTDIGAFSGSTYSPPWTERVNVFPAEVYPSSGTLEMIASAKNSIEGIDVPCIISTGTYSFGMLIDFSGVGGPCEGIIAFLMANHITGSGFSSINGYGLSFSNGSSGGTVLTISLVRIDAGVETILASCGTISADASHHVWQITRDLAGNMVVLKDGNVVGTTSTPDNTYPTNAYLGLIARTPSATIPGSIDFTIDTIQNSSFITLTMANFSGMTCYDALQKLAKLANYEFLFDADGTLIFRQKTPANLTPVVSIDQSDRVSKVMDFRLGHADIINVAQVTYGSGSSYVQYDSSTLPEAAPTSEQRYLQQIESEDYTDFLLTYDPGIAASRSQSLHDSQYRARRRVRLATKIIPQVDLSDVASFSFYNNPRMAGNIWGDPLEKWGGSAFGLPSNVLARNLNGKIIGMVLDPNNCAGEIELQEILP